MGHNVDFRFTARRTIIACDHRVSRTLQIAVRHILAPFPQRRVVRERCALSILTDPIAYSAEELDRT